MWCTFRIRKQDIWLSRKIKDQFNSTAHFSSFVLCYNLSMFCRCCCIEQPGSLFKTTGCCVIVLLLKFCCWGLILLYVLFFMLLTTARMYLYMLLLLFWSHWMLCLCCCYTDISVCFLVVVADHSLCRIVGISTALIYVCFIVVSNHSRGVIALLLLLLYWPLCMFCCCCRPQPVLYCWYRYCTHLCIFYCCFKPQPGCYCCCCCCCTDLSVCFVVVVADHSPGERAANQYSLRPPDIHNLHIKSILFLSGRTTNVWVPAPPPHPSP